MVDKEVLSRLYPINQNWYFSIIIVYPFLYLGCCPNHPLDNSPFVYFLFFLLLMESVRKPDMPRGWLCQTNHPILIHSATTVPTAGTAVQYIKLLDRKKEASTCIYIILSYIPCYISPMHHSL